MYAEAWKTTAEGEYFCSLLGDPLEFCDDASDMGIGKRVPKAKGIGTIFYPSN